MTSRENGASARFGILRIVKLNSIFRSDTVDLGKQFNLSIFIQIKDFLTISDQHGPRSARANAQADLDLC